MGAAPSSTFSTSLRRALGRSVAKARAVRQPGAAHTAPERQAYTAPAMHGGTMCAHSLISAVSVPQFPRPAPPRFSVSFLLTARRCAQWGQTGRPAVVALQRIGPKHTRGRCRHAGRTHAWPAGRRPGRRARPARGRPERARRGQGRGPEKPPAQCRHQSRPRPPPAAAGPGRGPCRAPRRCAARARARGPRGCCFPRGLRPSSLPPPPRLAWRRLQRAAACQQCRQREEQCAALRAERNAGRHAGRQQHSMR